MAAVDMKVRWVREVGRKAAARERAQEKAEAAYDDFYATLLAAFESGQMSYRQLAEASGLSRIRVGQALRIARQRRDEDETAKAS